MRSSTLTCAAVAALVIVVSLLSLMCRSDSSGGRIVMPQPIAGSQQPSSEAVAENRRRISVLQAMRERGIERGDIPTIVTFLEPVIPMPPPEVTAIDEGYAQVVAGQALTELGTVAHAALLHALDDQTVRRDAFVILANQGVKDVLDVVFGWDDARFETVIDLVGIYIGWERRVCTKEMRAWFRANREKLRFDPRTARFRVLD